MKDCGEFVILGTSEKLTVKVFSTQGFSADSSNHDWLEVQVTAQTNWFRAGFRESIMPWELAAFRRDLQKMHTELKGEAGWKAVENFIDLKAVMDKMGHIRWSVELIHISDSMDTLYFGMDSDQSYLPALLDQIDAILTAALEHEDP